MLPTTEKRNHESTKPVLNFEQRVRALPNLSPEALAVCDQAILGLLPSTDKKPLGLMTFAAAAKELQVGRSTILRLVEEGYLPTVTLRKGRRRIRRADLEELVFNSPEKL